MRNLCTIPECNNYVHGKGLCSLHYRKLLKYGDPLFAKEPRETFITCIVEGCETISRSIKHPYCEKHYYRIRRNGSIELKEKTGRFYNDKGYIRLYAPAHPLTIRHTGTSEYEHRIVYYNVHGAGPFKCNWCGKEVTWDDMHVDHLNDKHDDNSPGNLVSSCPVCNQKRGKHKANETMRNVYGRWIEYNGQRKMMSEWAKEIGITRASLIWRIKSGWTIERALTETRGKYGPRSQADKIAQ